MRDLLGVIVGEVVWVVFLLRFFLGEIELIVVSCGFVRCGSGFFVLAWKLVTSSTVTRPLWSTVFWKGSPATYVSSQYGTCYLIFCPCYFVVPLFCFGCSALAAWTRVSPVCSFLCCSPVGCRMCLWRPLAGSAGFSWGAFPCSGVVCLVCAFGNHFKLTKMEMNATNRSHTNKCLPPLDDGCVKGGFLS